MHKLKSKHRKDPTEAQLYSKLGEFKLARYTSYHLLMLALPLECLQNNTTFAKVVVEAFVVFFGNQPNVGHRKAKLAYGTICISKFAVMLDCDFTLLDNPHCRL